MRRIADREAIEDVLNRATLGFELSDPDLFSGAFAEDAVFQLDEKGPVFGFDKMIYKGRADIRSIITDRVEKAQQAGSQNPELRSRESENVPPQHR